MNCEIQVQTTKRKDRIVGICRSCEHERLLILRKNLKAWVRMDHCGCGRALSSYEGAVEAWDSRRPARGTVQSLARSACQPARGQEGGRRISWKGHQGPEGLCKASRPTGLKGSTSNRWDLRSARRTLSLYLQSCMIILLENEGSIKIAGWDKNILYH